MGTRPQQPCREEEEEELLGRGTTLSGQSISTSRSVGSPSSRSEQTMATPASDNTFLRLNHLDIHGDDAGSQGAAASKKKKRGQRAVGGDKSGRGLRQFSMKVCEKVESKGRTTYNEVKHLQCVASACLSNISSSITVHVLACRKDEKKCALRLPLVFDSLALDIIQILSLLQILNFSVELVMQYLKFSAIRLVAEVADELVAEFADPGNSISSPDQQQYDEKNIRRRVYDALNVLMAMDIISKDKKEIQWKGLPRTSLNDIEELKKVRLRLRNNIEKKAAYLQELEEQCRFADFLSYSVKYVGLQNLIQRNEQLYSSGNAPSGGVALPFILVQTRPHATVEVEISEDMQLVHFDFNSTPFELHDDNYVLKAMKFCDGPQNDNMTHNLTDGGEGSSMSGLYQGQVLPSVSTQPVRTPTSPPLPGILKARVKHEH
ncbi:transcription factor-like protein DPB isoform X1 [Senna tora]|uniref:Transcription factor-like protein DPB isoform X1 n=1 Tax=Senna tora TaxID=362788 RepID=A0A834X224_9FABA|nr:transcription factor-like protein DPB isoform X1 [Senna tora]